MGITMATVEVITSVEGRRRRLRTHGREPFGLALARKSANQQSELLPNIM
jgi:hypothetical protein